MSKFKALEQFEREFEVMNIQELRRWRKYWMAHTSALRGVALKGAQKRIHEIDKRISQIEREVNP